MNHRTLCTTIVAAALGLACDRAGEGDRSTGSFQIKLPQSAADVAKNASADAPASADAALDELAATLLGNKREDSVQAAAPAPRKLKRARVEDEPELEDASELPDDEGLSDKAFYAVVGSWRGPKDCLASEGLSAPSGALSVKFLIAKDGSVRASQIAEASTPAAAQISSCVERQARKIKFPSFDGEGVVSKDVKFVF